MIDLIYGGHRTLLSLLVSGTTANDIANAINNVDSGFKHLMEGIEQNLDHMIVRKLFALFPLMIVLGNS